MADGLPLAAVEGAGIQGGEVRLFGVVADGKLGLFDVAGEVAGGGFATEGAAVFAGAELVDEVAVGEGDAVVGTVGHGADFRGVDGGGDLRPSARAEGTPAVAETVIDGERRADRPEGCDTDDQANDEEGRRQSA